VCAGFAQVCRFIGDVGGTTVGIVRAFFNARPLLGLAGGARATRSLLALIEVIWMFGVGLEGITGNEAET
jgi:hypothetical protein